ncbi:hypothetical protein L914_06135 [Phytophthora nicotianae]|uniref:Uncharacterized protein n=2 Tax=Phytophthora nicotianae TaxID=4792 RepID=W2NPQ6_PHYNI|nr:hypothetical protein L914_06135 [Phytophthora nicotianae]
MNQTPPDPDPHAPESETTRQGRRLIRLLFRSSKEDEKNNNGKMKEQDNRAEDAASLKQATHTQLNSDQPPPVPATTSKFASLKRKLFPSQNRRYPRQVPPLISPITASVKPPLPPLGENLKPLSYNSTSRNDDENSDQNQANEGLFSLALFKDNQMSTYLESDGQEDTPESDFSLAEVDNNWAITCRRTLIDDDDDRDLESAVEALDLESSNPDKTLEEMSKAIDDLREWKQAHQQKTQEALDVLQAEQELQHSVKSSRNSIESEDFLRVQLQLKMQQQQRDREAQALELRKEVEAFQVECNVFKTTLDESEATRVEQALQNCTDSKNMALSRLRDELFQLDVKQRQEALLQELQGTDNALDMNIVNVQAFTGELDAILAQFDGDGVNGKLSAMAEDEGLTI